MTASRRSPATPRGRKSRISGASSRALGAPALVTLIEYLNETKLAPDLLSSTLPRLSILGRREAGEAEPPGLAHLRRASDGDWQPFDDWLRPSILSGLSESVAIQAWIAALGQIRRQLLSLLLREKRDPSGHVESVMTGLDEVLAHVSSEIWELYSAEIERELAQQAEDRLERLQELAERTEELHRSNQELEQFAYVASHDLQEPMRTVVNFAELFAERYSEMLDERGERYLHHIVEGSKRMQALVRALLSYSRVSSQGKEPVAVDSQVVIKSVCDSMRSMIQASGAEISWSDLPMVMADDVQLFQVLQNLIGNAIKFCNGGPPRISISATREKDTWIFVVRDNGIGIESEHAGRLFQMFQRLHPRGQYEGSGIGLALSKRIVERHGGRIWFESEPEKGSTFYFSLKAAD